MPAKPSWFTRVAAIADALRAADDLPFLDREAVERLFAVRRRRAQQLMRQWGGFQTGKSWLVDRREVLAALERLAQGQEFEGEWRRKTRVAQALEAAHRDAAARRVRIAAPAQAPAGLADLPPGIRLQPGELHIEFRDAEELLRRLLELAQAIGRDYARFETLIGI